jgi:hypothetical protein
MIGVTRGATAAEVLQPLRGTIPVFASTESARRRIEREGLRFRVVVAPGTGKLVGAVDRETLTPRACCRCEGRPCAVVRHLCADLAFCFGEEAADEVVRDEAELAEEGRVPAVRSIPWIVVDTRMVPLGIFTPPRGVQVESPPSPARAA